MSHQETVEKFKKVQSPEGATFLRDEIGLESPLRYTNGLCTRLNFSPIMLGLIEGGALITAPEEISNTHHDIEAGRAFVSSGVMAGRVAVAFLGEEDVNRLTFGAAGLPPQRFATHGMRETKLAEVADEGYELATPYHELLDDMQDRIIARPEFQCAYRRGFGYMYYIINAAAHTADLELMHHQLDNLDVDTEIAQFMNELGNQE